MNAIAFVALLSALVLWNILGLGFMFECHSNNSIPQQDWRRIVVFYLMVGPLAWSIRLFAWLLEYPFRVIARLANWTISKD